ncbi:beta-lactamase class A [Crossiella equi]|uniref:Beta-lactamase class A n=1 Tax=Crossiella equi TaxID=130796 RepID=A0ABS5AQ67_9PSEU|nr:class A beta-lactamase [Crossiella equi]MBP2478711.1 beta-lactamase class A [Crossiella equi]
MITRRALLGLVAALPLAACTAEPTPPVPPGTTPPPPPPPSPSTAAFDALEREFDARLGVYARHTGTGAELAHRADERFAFCSTFKALATAAVLHRNPLSHLDTLIRYGKGDLMRNGPITARNVERGMTIRELADAAVRFSDGAAGNLLLRDLGGPAELTAYARSLGDDLTRMDRVEPFITEATPGDPRDTTTPRAFGRCFEKVVLGDALPPDKRAVLRDLLERNTTGDKRIRAGLPPGWRAADKTGTGDYGTANDFALVWPPDGAPILIALMSSKATKDAAYDQALLAEAATAVTRAFA